MSLGTGQAYSSIFQIYNKLMEKHPMPAVVVFFFLFGSFTSEVMDKYISKVAI